MGGVISGGATSDRGYSPYITAREAAFPYDLINKSLSIQVEAAEATVKEDRIHILNSIVGNSGKNINDEPPTHHTKYDYLNNSLKGTFASSVAILQRAAQEDDKGWIKIIKALSKATVRGKMKFDFKADGPFGGLTAARATQLVSHLPLTIDKCEIYNAGAKYGCEFWDALIERVSHFHNLNMLDI